MQTNLQEKKQREGVLDLKSDRPGFDKPRKKAPITYKEIEEKMLVEISTVFRVDLDKAPEVKRSFTAWAQQWEN